MVDDMWKLLVLGLCARSLLLVRRLLDSELDGRKEIVVVLGFEGHVLYQKELKGAVVNDKSAGPRLGAE